MTREEIQKEIDSKTEYLKKQCASRGATEDYTNALIDTTVGYICQLFDELNS